MPTLSPQQTAALDKVREWYATHDDFTAEPCRLFGPAGTGKTTLAREVPAALGLSLDNVFYAAYTGKAANVLRSKGCTPASTLHSLVYKPVANIEAKRKLQLAQEQRIDLAQNHPTVCTGCALEDLDKEIAELERESKRIGFEWNPDSPLAYAALLILDEVSMVDAKLAADVERFGVPVLVLGDPEQLEPVGGEGYYTNAAPDVLLDEIHRQALDSPVLSLATRIRTSGDRRLGLMAEDLTGHSVELAMEHDQILCWKNATRWAAIGKIRGRLGRPADQPVAGDRIMCLTNNKDLGIFNGQQFDVLASEPGPLGPSMRLRDDQGVEREILGFADGFRGRVEEQAAKSRYDGGKGMRGLFTFAQAITVHKSQGSEWKTVYVVNEAFDLLGMEAARKGEMEARASARRWLYTAVTRASEGITITRPRGQ